MKKRVQHTPYLLFGGIMKGHCSQHKIFFNSFTLTCLTTYMSSNLIEMAMRAQSTETVGWTLQEYESSLCLGMNIRVIFKSQSSFWSMGPALCNGGHCCLAQAAAFVQTRPHATILRFIQSNKSHNVFYTHTRDFAQKIIKKAPSWPVIFLCSNPLLDLKCYFSK